MNWNLALVAGAAVAALLLASCVIPPEPGGTVIRNPTVEDMERIEAEMGVKPKPRGTSPSTPSASPGVYIPDSTPVAPAQPPTAATVPLESVQPASVTPELQRKLN